MITVVDVLESGWNFRAGRARSPRSRTTRTFPAPSFTTPKGETEPGARPRASWSFAAFAKERRLVPRAPARTLRSRILSAGRTTSQAAPFRSSRKRFLQWHPGTCACRDPRFAHGADRFVGNRAGLDAEPGQEREQAWRVERSVQRGFGTTRFRILNPAARRAYNPSAGGTRWPNPEGA